MCTVKNDKRSENIEMGMVAPAKLEKPMKYMTWGNKGLSPITHSVHISMREKNGEGPSYLSRGQ